ncbi:MAG: transcription elongation factor GreA [Deltaproteobacteria bacterium]|nr:transcription elongation factor GreA [Deltaproteobacteria bacterium]
MNKALLTQEGYWRLLQELKRLRRYVRPLILEEVMEAAAEGRLEKNESYWEARSRQAQVDQKIHSLQELISQSEVLVGTNLTPSQVRFNCRVKVCNLATGEISIFHLVSSAEADVRQGYLSVESPMGKALLGSRVGERIGFNPPGGHRAYQVLEIQTEGF